jgi:hypothetical protein
MALRRVVDGRQLTARPSAERLPPNTRHREQASRRGYDSAALRAIRASVMPDHAATILVEYHSRPATAADGARNMSVGPSRHNASIGHSGFGQNAAVAKSPTDGACP